MSVTERYRVAGAHSHPTTEIVTLADGTVTSAIVNCLEVELVSSDHRHGSQKLRFVGGTTEAAKDEFIPDADVDVTYSKVDKDNV